MFPEKIILIATDSTPLDVAEKGAGSALELLTEDGSPSKVLLACPGCSELLMVGDRFSSDKAMPKISTNPRLLTINIPIKHKCGTKFTVSSGTINWIEYPKAGDKR